MAPADGQSLQAVLAKVKRGPALVDERGEGGAVLALALHCLMVKEGFQPWPANRQSPAAPVADWNHRYRDEWLFEYSRRGFDSVFVLHCSLQAASGRMFVQGREKDNSPHMHNLGLQLSKYIPDPERCKQPTWHGVLESADVLEEMVREYIAGPLLAQAVPSAQAATLCGAGKDWLQRTADSAQRRGVLLPLGIGAAFLAIAVAAALAYRRRSGNGG